MYCLLFEARIVHVFIRLSAKPRVYNHLVNIISDSINKPKLIAVKKHELQFREVLNSNNSANSVLLSRERISEIVRIYSAPPPQTSAGYLQRYYRIQKKYVVKQTQTCDSLFSCF